MLISWIKKTTLLDFPGKVATIVFTLGCNFRCHYCHNYEFVLPEKVADFMNDLIPEVAFFNFLKTRVWFLDWVVITGWEPTIQKDLYEFIVKIKELWFLVKLDTNWQNPELLERLIAENLLDYVAMDIKYPFLKYKKIIWVDEDIAKFIKSKDILLNWNLDYEFRTTISKWYFDEQIIKEIWEDIVGAKRWYLQNLEEKNLLNAGFDGKSFTPDELNELQVVWAGYVDVCEVRK